LNFRHFILNGNKLTNQEKAGSVDDIEELDVIRIRGIAEAFEITKEKFTFSIDFASGSPVMANATAVPPQDEYVYTMFLKANSEAEKDIWKDAIKDSCEVVSKRAKKPSLAAEGRMASTSNINLPGSPSPDRSSLRLSQQVNAGNAPAPTIAGNNSSHVPIVIIFDYGLSDPSTVAKPPVYDGETNPLGQKHGQGMFVRNGYRYQGSWVANQRQGYGRYTSPDGRSYEGFWKHDKPEGFGTFRWPTGEGSFYEGHWINGFPDGSGKLVRSDGSVYFGKWNQGIREGFGCLSWTTGDRYEGNFKNDVANGHGILVSGLGDIYEGQWFKGMMHGKGIYHWVSRRVKYEGEFRYDECHGRAVITYPDGIMYDGECKKNLRHGYGKFTFRNGDIYEGQWNNDKIEGNGEMHFQNGWKYLGGWTIGIFDRHGSLMSNRGVLFKGNWKLGKKNGFGEIIYKSGRKFSGNYKNGVPHGEGNFTFKDSSYFSGTYDSGKKHGLGTFEFPDGSSYVGEFKDNVINGTGKMMYRDGTSYEGGWLNGKWHGAGAFTLENGDRWEGQFLDGKYDKVGVLKYANKNVYKGAISKFGVRHGQGNMFWSNGELYEGEWRRNKRHGKGKMYLLGNYVIEGTFSNDFPHLVTIKSSINKNLSFPFSIKFADADTHSPTLLGVEKFELASLQELMANLGPAYSELEEDKDKKKWTLKIAGTKSPVAASPKTENPKGLGKTLGKTMKLGFLKPKVVGAKMVGEDIAEEVPESDSKDHQESSSSALANPNLLPKRPTEIKTDYPPDSPDIPENDDEKDDTDDDEDDEEKNVSVKMSSPEVSPDMNPNSASRKVSAVEEEEEAEFFDIQNIEAIRTASVIEREKVENRPKASSFVESKEEGDDEEIDTDTGTETEDEDICRYNSQEEDLAEEDSEIEPSEDEDEILGAGAFNFKNLPVELWNTRDVCGWLKDNELDLFVGIFWKYDVDGERLLGMTRHKLDVSSIRECANIWEREHLFLSIEELQRKRICRTGTARFVKKQRPTKKGKGKKDKKDKSRDKDKKEKTIGKLKPSLSFSAKMKKDKDKKSGVAGLFNKPTN
jgi:hypothetical protein